MSTFKKSTAGFTLIELMIVVIIVAVLAAVGIPLMRGNVDRAKLSEADAGLGTIRTAVRSKIAESGAPATTIAGNATRTEFNFKLGDLTGRYFDDNDYSYTLTTNATATAPAVYCISVTGGGSNTETGATAKKAADVSGMTRSMNQDGDIFTSADCTGTAIN